MKKGKRLKELREGKGLTMDYVAAKLDTTKQTIYKYENDIVTNIPSDKVEALAKLYNVAPSYIMCWDDDPPVYYFDPDAAEVAQEIHDNPELRVLFDAARDASADDLKTTYQMLMALKKKDEYNGDEPA